MSENIEEEHHNYREFNLEFRVDLFADPKPTYELVHWVDDDNFNIILEWIKRDNKYEIHFIEDRPIKFVRKNIILLGKLWDMIKYGDDFCKQMLYVGVCE